MAPRDTFVARGIVCGVNGRGLPDLLVRLFDKDLRTEQLLGEALTNADGRYEITYKSEQFRRAEKRSADLILRAFSRAVAAGPAAPGAAVPAAEPIASSGVVFNARAEETIDLLVRQPDTLGASEYERYVGTIAPLLEEVPLDALNDDDIRFVSAESGLDLRRIALLVRAAAAAAKTAIPAPVFYGLFRQGMPASLAALLLKPRRVLRHALERALSQRLIPSHLERELDALLDSLHALLARQDLEPNPASALLETVSAPAATRSTFLSQYLRHEGTTEEFWRDFARQPGVTAGQVQELRFTLQLNLLAEGNVPLVRAVRASGAKSARDLVGLDEQAWRTLIQTAGAEAVPSGVPGSTPADRTAAFAKQIVATVHEAFAMERVRVKAVEDASLDPRLRRDLTAFFDAAPEFDLEEAPVGAYVREHPEALAGVEDRAALTAHLKRLQRVYRIAPRYEAMQALLEEGFHSALDVVAMPQSRFLAEFGERLGGATQAQMYYTKAQQAAAGATHMYAMLHQALNGPEIAAAGSGRKVKDSLTDVVSVEELFGAMDFCECRHCRSIFGPAAYFVDLLQYLRKGSPSAFQVLQKRRPDLQHLTLSCENTNTPVPYVDLVNEILEAYVHYGDFAQVSPQAAPELAHDTALSASELSVNAEHTLEAAYTKLKTAVHTSELPFDRPLEIVRAYLEHLGTSRHAVMTAFQNGSDPTAKTPTDLAIALESLGISADERTILAGASVEPPRAFFGYPAATAFHVDSGGNVITEPWRANLARVPEFLRRTGLTYAELVDLLETRFINPAQDPQALPADAVVLFSHEGVCDLTRTWIQHPASDHDNLDATGLQNAAWLRLHRFLRLWKKLGWSVRELDLALRILGTGDIDDGVLQKLACVKRLQATLNLPLDELLAFWGPIDTFGDAALYDRLFRNQAVVHDPADASFALNAQGTALADPNATLSAHVPALLAALRVRADDLATLRQAIGLADQENPPAAVPMTLDALSALFRYVTLARALKLKIAELISLTVLTGMNPFPTANPAETERFVGRARGVTASRFSVAQLDYLLRHRWDAGRPAAPLQETVEALLKTLQEDLRKIVDDTAPAPDPTGEGLRVKLALAIDPTLVDAAMEVIDGLPAGLVPDKDAFIDQHFAIFLADLAEAKAVLLNAPSLTVAERRDYVFPRLLAYLRDTMSRDVVTQTLGDALKIDTALLKPLLEDILVSIQNPQRPAMDDFLALAGDGLLAQYFDEKNLQGNSVTRIDPAVNFYWGDAPPASGLTPETFSARWTGFLVPPRKEDYRFYVRANDGVRLWIGDLTQPLIDAWQNQNVPVEHEALKALEAGSVYPIQVEYFKDGPGALVEVSWSSLSTPKAPVPQSRLYSGAPFVLDELVKLYGRLHKIALLAGRFRLRAAEIGYINAHGQDFAGFDLGALPIQTSDAQAVALFERWEAVRDFTRLRDALPAGDLTVLDVLAAAADPAAPPAQAASAARDVLAALAGWKRADLEFLATDALGVPDAAFRSASGPLRLKAAFDLAGRLGLSVEQLRAWTIAAPDADQAKSVIQAVKARYDDRAWLSAAKPLSDALREKQRRALVAYVLAQPHIVQEGIADADGLFEYFLIDVQMDPCMMTSRIKQAISSVQLFVQRCFLNLEKGAPATFLDADRWAWMKNYRVWEANRKVFCWPENFIRWEWRDDKSPFFREFETQLLQNDPTEEHIESAFMGYLERLDEVARLELAGLCREKEGARDVVHLLARTFNPPFAHYYRRFDARTETWTAWEKIPIDVDGEHLIPVVWNRRLHLFWPLFNEKPDNNKNPSANGKALPDGAGPFTYWEIKLAWSERRASGWTPKQTSGGALTSEGFWTHNDFGDVEVWCLPEKKRHFFKTSIDGESLTVDVFRRYDDYSEKMLYDGEYYDPMGTWLPYQGHELVGTFRFTGCRGRAELDTYSHTKDYDTLKGPELTANEFMGFRRRFGNGYLTLQDAASTEILEEVSDPFTFLHAPSVQDPAQLPYPFLFQDERRGYFVMPTPDSPARKREVFKNPPFAVKPEIDHVAVSRKPDFGPGPVEMGTRFPLFEMMRSAARQAGGGFPARSATGPALVLASAPVLEGYIPVAGTPGEPQMMFMKSSKPSAALDPAAEHAQAADLLAQALAAKPAFKFHTMYHPHVCPWIKALNKGGIGGALTLGNQKRTDDPTHTTLFDEAYKPTSKVHSKKPKANVEFEPYGSYALFNWEFFVFGPLLVADRCCGDQRFELAQKWFHYVFNPTDHSPGEVPARYWKALPLQQHDEIARIQDLLEKLNHGTAWEKKTLEQRVEEWRDNPFNPHLIARFRPTAYKLAIVMKYLDNLIAWGDHLFARDTLESINEATQVYVLAHSLLGRRPAFIPARTKATDMSYAALRPHLDAFSNAWVELENLFPSSSIESLPVENGSVGPDALGTTMAFYFCIPPNETLLKYWDVVEDRLFKIRHCMNIEGVTRELPLFEPPIDPALLVKAAAMGLDFGSVLADVGAPAPLYRFSLLLEKAVALCGEVKSLGAALLAALEKKDAEALASLRAAHETALLEAARDVRVRQVDEARTQLEALVKSRAVTEERHRFYSEITHRTELESEHLRQLGTAHQLNQIAQIIEFAASAAGGVPNFSFGTAGSMGSPLSSVSFGGGNIAAATQSHARSFSYLAASHTHSASLAGIIGGWARRSAEWRLLARETALDLQQIDKQIAGGEVRVAMAELELANHDRQIARSAEMEAFLRNKYTNEELYGWMQSQISAVYFQTYKLAYELAKRAEKAYRFERGLAASNFVQFGYWDSVKKGLLAGERLLLDLKRLEAAYLDQNKREYEIAKHVSLAALDPLALLALRETGRCEFRLPEAVFDLDYPGHYMRRLKTVSLTIPCVTGPYTGVHCTLTLLRNKVRIDPNAQRPYGEEGADDARFVTNFAAVQSVATSTAQNDAGLFEVNFRDERYLPFEGAGADSAWRLEMPKDCNAFDFDTIADVILRVQYTARDGGELLRKAALAAATLPPPEAPQAAAALPAFPSQEGQLRLFSGRREFPNEWHRFFHPPDAETTHTLVLDLTVERFPFRYRERALAVTGIELFLKLRDAVAYEDHATANPAFSLRHVEPDGQPGESFPALVFKTLGSPLAGLAHVEAFGDEVSPQPIGRWVVEVSEQALQNAVPAALVHPVTIDGQPRARLNAEAVEDLFVLVHYTVGQQGA